MGNVDTAAWSAFELRYFLYGINLEHPRFIP